ncbi:ATP-dependent helicase, partial [Streptomyces sp. SID10853]|nr:ATP-dependent helicase [Streptomyces sp. SID10853]
MRQTAETQGASGAGSAALTRQAVVFLPAALPRDGRFAFWDPEGEAAGPDELVVVRRHGTAARRSTVPAVLLPLTEALPLLVAARHSPVAHPAARCWSAAAG